MSIPTERTITEVNRKHSRLFDESRFGKIDIILRNAEFLERIESGVLAFLIVVMPKSKGDLWMSGDFRVGWNSSSRNGVKFTWVNNQQKAFEKIKQQSIETTNFNKFDPTMQYILSKDASSLGIGAKYSHLEKECPAVIYGLKKFHPNLFGREFEIIIDNKAILSFFDSNRAFPNTKSRAKDDSLSIMPAGPGSELDERYSNRINSISLICVRFNYDILRMETRKDKLVDQPRIDKDWPLYWYYSTKDNLSCDDLTLVLNRHNSRIIIPSKLRSETLKRTHDAIGAFFGQNILHLNGVSGR
ncbi:hypothetical protein RF11_01401 [Thelohanellus kitauei]|uniref:Reverse transcriptase RNase H-like domain-containing protein n=1 Tax=Thelohanellus kitauei TaxID=669202 RepID=A0A0C2MWX4_THEKT|nr:hypothetical protein RF11_01401 [Thelohanellus kitauei]